ncbi:hypothetical protein A3G54_02860 [Candidatus Giovannonibacteria bacterium RIFCSPLOWO2_12_FULL_44_15]|nr:MAG: hypothetical protein A3G54_02860 [Candidatus Giovannonibacteria bacterium RIFCSPLOWO2_12_FULL_44_15]
MQTSPPEICFYCRLQKHLAFWEFGKFHKRKCDLTGEDIISLFSFEAHFPVYKTSEWYSDSWMPPEMEYNPSRLFFDQLSELQSKTPHPHQFGTKNTNCDYSADVWESKNCYLCRSIANSENLSYSLRDIRCRDSYELTYCYDTEQSYDCTYCFKVYSVKYVFDVRDSFDSAFLYDCRNVSNCFMCWNLRNKKFHILNQPYTKEEYFKKIKEYNLNSWETVRKLKNEFAARVREDAIHRQNMNTKLTNSTGNGLTECKNCANCYFLENSENCKNIFRGFQNKDTQDATAVWKTELAAEVVQITQGYKLKYSIFCTNCRESEYLDFCIECENCFGCVGLKKKQYCILNKQYTKGEYEKITIQIRENIKSNGLRGQFLPLKMAYVGYNLSYAGILFPLSRNEVEKIGGYWEELENASTENIKVSEYVDDIHDVKDDIIYEGLICQETNRPFNVKLDELNFYKQKEIPLPRTYPDVRTIKRMRDLTLIKPFPGKCFFCAKEIIHYYPPEFGYKKIACEACYLKEVV